MTSCTRLQQLPTKGVHGNAHFWSASGFEHFQNKQAYKMQRYKHACNKDKEKVVKS